jgi:phosphotransferase system enzyme I (PtsI)
VVDLLTGSGVGSGSVAGPVARVGTVPALPVDLPAPEDTAAELARATEALEAVAADLERRAGTVAGEAAEILRAQALLARDPALVERVARRVAAGEAAAPAVAAAVASFGALLAAAGPPVAERVADLEDVRDRAVARLLGLPLPGLPDPGHPFVLVARDLAPADTATLDAATVLAIVTERGGPTSHTAILARSLGIPAVVACAGAAALLDGEPVLVDAGAGTVLRDPDQAAVRAAAARPPARRQAGGSGPGRTADGAPVPLLANVGGDRDLAAADAAGAEGVGLFRTEFLFLDRPEPPPRAEQEAAYAEVFAAFAGRRVVVRTLDAGTDKPLRFVAVADEPNPALGVRGLRVVRGHPELLEAQLAAIAAAAARTEADVWVMAPMVSVAAEAREFADRAHAAGLPVAGVMVEVPSAALRASRVLAACDFASLGTNDLAQYAFAADRGAGELAHLLDPWEPGLLELVRLTAAAGSELGKPVGVCGEAAGDPLLAPVLVGLGADSLSMTPASLPAVRMALAAHTLAECRELAAAALSADDGAGARTAVAERAHPA